MNLKRLISALGLSALLAAFITVAFSAASPRSIAQARPDVTHVGGVIAQSVTWDLAGSPYIMDTSVVVIQGVTLTIDPGVIVQGQTNAELRVYGQFNAIGTTTQPITFTAVDESDWNGWPGLLFDGAFASGDLRHVTVRYGQSSYGSTTGLRDALAVRNVLTGEVRIESSQVISTSAGDATPNVGIYVENSHVLISDTLLSGIGVSANGYPLRVKGLSSIITLTHNTFTGNLNDRILLEADALMGQDTTLVPQTGLQGYEFLAGFNVPATRTLTLAPGAIMLGRGDAELRVYGRLNAIGTLTQPITLTAVDESGWHG